MTEILYAPTIIVSVVIIFVIVTICVKNWGEQCRGDGNSSSTNQLTRQISTIYTPEFLEQNDKLPSYTEIFIGNLPTYEEVINQTKENAG